MKEITISLLDQAIEELSEELTEFSFESLEVFDRLSLDLEETGIQASIDFLTGLREELEIEEKAVLY